MQSQQVKIQKKDKWAHMLPDLANLIAEKVSLGWDGAFVDGSRDSPREWSMGER